MGEYGGNGGTGVGGGVGGFGGLGGEGGEGDEDGKNIHGVSPQSVQSVPFGQESSHTPFKELKQESEHGVLVPQSKQSVPKSHIWYCESAPPSSQ